LPVERDTFFGQNLFMRISQESAELPYTTATILASTSQTKDFLGASDFLARRLEMGGAPWRYSVKFGLQRR
jgi:hypothetical protein